MRSLFSKIFLGFWLSHLLAAVLVFALLKATESRRMEEFRRNEDVRRSSELRQRPEAALSGATMARYAGQASELASRSGVQDEQLKKLLARMEAETKTRVALFDARGVQVAGTDAPDESVDLVKRALKSSDMEMAIARWGIAGAHRAQSPQGEIFVLVSQVPRFRRGGGPPGQGGGNPGLGGNFRTDRLARGGAGRDPRILGLGRQEFYEAARLLAVLVAATIVSLGLARSLTSPTVKLRRATQQLASGDLTARVGPQMGGRRDELADLAKDFDLMAERMASMMASERRLLGDISHELRSPLARLQVAVDLAGQTADAETQAYLARIEREAERLNLLIGQLLTLTRLENAGAETTRQPVLLEPLVEEVAADGDFEARSRNRAVRFMVPDKSCPEHAATLGTCDMLRSAIENVVRNAIHYTPESADVEISLSCVGGTATITVRDHGPGVPPEALTELFRPFYRVAEARDRQSGGVGLGLSIAERAVRFHGGAVQASNAPGGGLSVEISLPLMPTSH